MDKNTVIWWLFDPPSDSEQKSLDAMHFTNVVWANDGLEYMMLDGRYTEPGAAATLVSELLKFAKKHNATAIIGSWNDAVYAIIKSVVNPFGIKCYSSREIFNKRTSSYKHRFVLIGEI